MYLGRQNLIGDFNIKSHQPITEKRIDFKLLRISAISRGPLDRRRAEDCWRLSQSKRYRMVPLSGTFTVESGGVFVPQISKTATFKPKVKISLYN
jgi:hypothetical protein